MKEISLQEIIINENQPRKEFDEKKISELADSIKQHGLLQPIIVKQTDNQKYQIVAGERRYRAVKKLGAETIMAIIQEVDAKEGQLIAILENIQRENLSFFDEAFAYLDILRQYGMSQTELASQLGKNQATIANKLRLLVLPREAILKIRQNGLSERHARALLKIKDQDLLFKILDKVIDKQLTVKETEKCIAKCLEKKEKNDQPAEANAAIRDIRIFTNTIKKAVQDMNGMGVPVIYEMNQHENRYIITIEVPLDKK